MYCTTTTPQKLLQTAIISLEAGKGEARASKRTKKKKERWRKIYFLEPVGEKYIF